MTVPPQDPPVPDPFEAAAPGDGLEAFDQAQKRSTVPAAVECAAPAAEVLEQSSADVRIILLGDDGLDDFAPEPGRAEAAPSVVVVEPQAVAGLVAESARHHATWRVVRAALVCAASLAAHELLLPDQTAWLPAPNEASVVPITESRALAEVRTTGTAATVGTAPVTNRADRGETPVLRRVARSASETPTSVAPASDTLAAAEAPAPPVPVAPEPSPAASPSIIPALPTIDDIAVDASLPETAPAVVPALAPDARGERPPPAPPTAATSTAPRETDARAIEDVLGQYRQAFNRLDAGAASAVWPSVNERTLARAFDSLEGQDVSFDRCRIDVAVGQAEAACSGHARYVPKVGNRTPRAEAREWTFTLRKAESGWLIDRVDAR